MADMCLMPPSVTREVNFLVLSVFAAEGMPKMDDKELGGLVKAGIDAFVVAKVREGCFVGCFNRLVAATVCTQCMCFTVHAELAVAHIATIQCLLLRHQFCCLFLFRVTLVLMSSFHRMEARTQ